MLNYSEKYTEHRVISTFLVRGAVAHKGG